MSVLHEPSKIPPQYLANALAMRRLVLSSLFVAVALVFLHQSNHAHAREPTRCGFWSSMDAGMSCQ
jgi:hypothetical protein